MVRNSSNSLKIVLFVSLIFTLTLGYLYAEPVELVTAPEVRQEGGALFDDVEADPIVLKLMVVNPSQKYEQTFPLKAYLPEEVKPEFILESKDLELGYDAERGAHYVEAELLLQPGESIVKAIKIKDIWFIPNVRLNEYTLEARDLMDKIRGSNYEERARLLMLNIETLLLQVYESQIDKSLTPDEHIAVFRDNKKKIRDVEMDLMVMRRFLASTGGDLSVSKANGEGSSSPLPSFLNGMESQTLQDDSDGAAQKVAPAVLWRIVFIILIFLGVVCLFFMWMLQAQMKTNKMRKKQAEAEKAKKAKASGIPGEVGKSLDDYMPLPGDNPDSKDSAA